MGSFSVYHYFGQPPFCKFFDLYKPKSFLFAKKVPRTRKESWVEFLVTPSVPRPRIRAIIQYCSSRPTYCKPPGLWTYNTIMHMVSSILIGFDLWLKTRTTISLRCFRGLTAMRTSNSTGWKRKPRLSGKKRQRSRLGRNPSTKPRRLQCPPWKHPWLRLILGRALGQKVRFGWGC